MSKNRMLVNVILDRSGSMRGLVDSVIENYNNYIEELRGLEDVNIRISLVQFDNEYEEVYLNKSLKYVPKLDRTVYYSRGVTALLDAIGRTIRAVESIKNIPEKVIFVINTDGYENASQEFTRSQIKEMISGHEVADNWQFIFIGAGIDAIAEGGSVGVRAYNTLNTSNSTTGVDYNYTVLSAYSGSVAGASPGDFSSITMADSVGVVGTEEEVEKKKKEKVTSNT